MEEIILYCRKSLKEIIFSQRLFLKSDYDCNSKFTRSVIYETKTEHIYFLKIW